MNRSDLTRDIHQSPAPLYVLGGGSNTIAADTGFRGTVLRIATHGIHAHILDNERVELIVQAGHPLGDLIAFTVAEGLSGIEYLGGIPGTAGAAPVQNTGAYGQQISDTLTRLTAYDWHLGHSVELRPADCGFGYRTSIFKDRPSRWTILTITVALGRSNSAAPVSYPHLANILGVPLGAQPPLTEAAHGVLADRNNRGLTLPASGPDARQVGSVFLNPTITGNQARAVRAAGGPVNRSQGSGLRASAGWLLESAGYRPGAQVTPGVYCSSRRTLTLTARRGATSTSFDAALRTLAARVFSATTIRLTPEPRRPSSHSAPPSAKAGRAKGTARSCCPRRSMP
ncbi:UDP-N-acetylmuramate dehydrogenase [Streptomyces chiangmaiensis]|uniref:UDP-N-acetylenolpyruvoylglucosamine reductase n=1 Tax=Streptomyces chiangmaiensis TaxID=766497 RepID=A0ABU7FU12_9ACTN|nr:UDP-N-acetylmuramate dehydrogenase [Streptomyces chiangmaiensis]MED7827449.1 UDP-N-acetylmuramate dehydrogenase [Streptomyces chiangmaiensis]